MKKKLIIFDFDGTLADIEVIVLQIFNTLANEFGYDPIIPKEIPLLKKMGAKEFIKQRVKIPFWKKGKLIKRGLEEYKKNMSAINLFPGTKELLLGLKQQGIDFGVLSSNSIDIITELLEKNTITPKFVNHSSIFGKAKSLKVILKQEQLTAEEVWYVGDEVRDVNACAEAGVPIIAVTWGLNDKEVLQKTGALTADTREELLAKLIS